MRNVGLALGRRGALGRMLGIAGGAALAPLADKFPLGVMASNVSSAGRGGGWIGGAADASTGSAPLSATAQLLQTAADDYGNLAMEKAQQRAYLSGLDPDIASLRLPAATLMRMQRTRNRESNSISKSLWARFHQAAGWTK